MWCPPTPPQDQCDVYIDNSLKYLYQSTPILEDQLPPVYVKRELKRSRTADLVHSAEGRRSAKLSRKDEIITSVPRSLFDHPASTLARMRRDVKLARYKGLAGRAAGLPSSTSTIPLRPPDENCPDWSIHEDFALLQAIEEYQELPLNMLILKPGHVPNWDLVAEKVNQVSCTVRSAAQCRTRYESVIIPREEGRPVVDLKKAKKNKGFYKLPMVKSNRPLRTCQLNIQDKNASYTEFFHQRFDHIKQLASNRKPAPKPLLVNPQLKNPKHAAVLVESGIIYDAPLTPEEVAKRRQERIARERSKQQQLQQAAQQQQQIAGQSQLSTGSEQMSPQTRPVAVARVSQIQQTGSATVVSTAANSVSTTVVNLQPAVQSLVTCGVTTAVQTTAVVTSSAPSFMVSGSLNSPSTNQLTTLQTRRPITAATIPVGLHEMVVTTSQPRAQGSAAASVGSTTGATTAVVSVAGLTSAQLQGARIATGGLVTLGTAQGVKGATVVAASAVSTAAASGGVSVTTAKTITPAQMQYYKHQAILRQQPQRVTQQQLKVIQTGQPTKLTMTAQAAGLTQAQVTTAGVSVGVTGVQHKTQYLKQQPVSVTSATTTQTASPKARSVSANEELAQTLVKQQLQRQQQQKAAGVTVAGTSAGGQQTLTAQFLPAGAQQVTALVKTAAAVNSGVGQAAGTAYPLPSITIPHQVVKASLSASGLKSTAVGGVQQMRQLGLANYQQLLTKQGARVQTAKVAQITKPGMPTQLIVQQAGKTVPTLSMQQIQQVLKNVTSSQSLPSGSQVVLAKAAAAAAAVGSSNSATTAGVSTVTTLGTARTTVATGGVGGAASGTGQTTRQTIQVLPGGLRGVQQVQVTNIPGLVRPGGLNPVRIQTTSGGASGTPLVAVAVQQSQQQQSQQQDSQQQQS